MLKSKNQSLLDEFNTIVQNVKALQDMKDENQSQETYLKFLMEIDQRFEQILNKKQQLNSYSIIQTICEQIILLHNFSNKLFNNISIINKTLIVLSHAQKIIYTEYKVNLTPFFINCCIQTSAETKENFSTKYMELFFNHFLSNDHFSFNFFNNSLYQEYFNQFLPRCNNLPFIDWSLNLIVNFPHKNSFESFDCDSLFQTINEFYQKFTVSQEITETSLLAVTKLFYRMSFVNRNCKQSFLRFVIPQIIDKKIISEDKWRDCFSTLLSANTDIDSPAPNEGIFNFLFGLSQLIDTKTFKKFFIFKKFESYKCDQNIEKYFPKIQDLLDFLSNIIDSIIQLNLTVIFTNLLQSTFRLFSVRMIDDALQYNQLISIIEKSKISFDEFPSKFIKCFLRTPSPATLDNLFKNDFLLKMSLHYFSLPIMKESQPTTFQYLFELSDKQLKILVKFLNANPTKRLLRCLMNCILQNPTNNGFLIIMSSFHESEEVCEKFVACDGLQFLDKCLKDGFLSLDMFAMIIATLVSHRLFPEVDKFISKLDKSHPLFSLSHKQLENIVYGENSGRFRPLRVPSLFYLLQDKETIDPYNSYLLGRFGLKSFLKNGYDIYSIPFIKEISNRYLLSKHVDLMLNKPEHFDDFCDNKTFDHFSLFVLYPLRDELLFKGDFNAISFWVRFEHNSNKGINYFFSDGNVYLSVEQDQIKIEILTAKSDKMFISSTPNQTVLFTNEERWIHIYITTEDERRSSKKTVFINGENKLSCNVQLLPKEKEIGRSAYLYNYGQKLMYIGPAIRFYSKQATNFSKEIYNSGPGCLNFFSSNKIKNIDSSLHTAGEFIITPFNLSRKNMEIGKEVPPNCYTVPYFGFPFHFLSNRRLSDLFTILNCSKDEDSFNFIFKTLLTINSIIGLNPDRFFRQLLNSMMIKKQFISKSIFKKALRSVFGQQPSNIILQSILFDRDMWEKVDPKMLSEVLFDDLFKTPDFSNVPNYELFLLINVRKHPECVEAVIKNIQKVPSLSKLLLDTLKYKKKKVEIQLTIAENYAKCIQNNTFFNETVLFNQLKEFLIISVKPLAAQIFNIMTIISIKKKESFPLTSSILYSVMQLVSYESVWKNTFDLNRTFPKVYISLLLGLIWSCSYGEIFSLTFSDKVIDRSNSYNLKHILYLKENASLIVNDKLSFFLITNLFPILYNVTEFEIGGLKTDMLNEFTQSILQCFNVVFPKYYTYKPEITKKYFNNSPLIHLYSAFLKECNSEWKFKQVYFALFVGVPFFNSSMYSEYSPNILIAFLSNYTSFEYSNLFFKYLIYPVSQKILSIDQLENILTLVFDICDTETKIFSTINILLYSIYVEYSDCKIIYDILEGKIDTFYNIISSQGTEVTWFYLLSSKKEILNMLKEYDFTPNDRNQLNNLISIDNNKNNIDMSAFRKKYSSMISAISKEFVNNENQYKKNESSFFKEIINQIETSKNDSKQVHESIKKKKSELKNSIEFVEEKMHWSHFLSSLSVKMSEVSQFNPKTYFLSNKCMPYNCPQLISPSLFESKDEVTELFNENISGFKKYPNVAVKMFIKSESMPDNIMIVDCKICRYRVEIPSIMFLLNTGIYFLTYAELASQKEIRLLDKSNNDFIASVLNGQWGTTSIFSGHIVLKIEMNDIIFIQFLMYKAFNIWSFKHGQFTVKIDSNKLRQIKYPLSLMTTKVMDNFSSFNFLFKIEDYSSAFNKWCRCEISTDDLLLVSNGLSRRSFTNLKCYPYFPFIFEENIQLSDNSQQNSSISSSFVFASNISLVPSSSSALFISSAASSQYLLLPPDQKNYMIPFSSNETAGLLRSIQPFSSLVSSDFSSLLKNDLPEPSIPKAESASDLKNSLSYGDDISTNCQKDEVKQTITLTPPPTPTKSKYAESSDIIKPNRDLSASSGEEYSEQPNIEDGSVMLESLQIDQMKYSQPNLNLNINVNSNILINTNRLSESENIINENKTEMTPQPSKTSFGNFFSNLFQKEKEGSNNNNDRINRTKLASFSSTNTDSLKPLGNIPLRKRFKRYSDAPSNLIPKSIVSANPSSILSETKKVSISQLDTTIKAFAQPLLQSYQDECDRNDSESTQQDNEQNPYLHICPANFFYSPEIIKKISNNPFFCVQKHRESLENVNNAEFIAEWIVKYLISEAANFKIRRFVSLRTEQFHTTNHIFSLDLTHMSQKLNKGCKPSKTLMFTGDNKLKRIKRLSMRVFESYFAVIDKKDLTLSIIDFSSNMKRKSTKILCYHDKFFALSRSICVSINGIFISVDFEFGITRVYRILYQKGIPNSIVLISDFSSSMSPISVINGNKWICATASLSQLVLWNIIDGTIHRVLNFGSSKITALSMDEESGVWVATENKGYFISINGEILAQIELPEEVSQIKAISIHSSIPDRAAACGTISGKVFLLCPRFDTKTIDTKQLKGGHSHEIMQIVVNKNLKMFITVDSKNNSVLWTAKRLPCENLNISVFDKCPLCNQKPETFCSSCNRPICKKCSIHGICQTCYSLN
ncbi:hypothetical protein M9Y10_034904 [Tritrichomonas musculus]|uniref:BEACH domain-containing protein n=1 Tax=Tritrichomonas musculus TaxID=1915356 RepID=A0ABR2KG82_9EUKA